jgi:hypothetical protein
MKSADIVLYRMRFPFSFHFGENRVRLFADRNTLVPRESCARGYTWELLIDIPFALRYSKLIKHYTMHRNRIILEFQVIV